MKNLNKPAEKALGLFSEEFVTPPSEESVRPNDALNKSARRDLGLFTRKIAGKVKEVRADSGLASAVAFLEKQLSNLALHSHQRRQGRKFQKKTSGGDRALMEAKKAVIRLHLSVLEDEQAVSAITEQTGKALSTTTSLAVTTPEQLKSNTGGKMGQLLQFPTPSVIEDRELLEG